jgi:hypothetical protein
MREPEWHGVLEPRETVFAGIVGSRLYGRLSNMPITSGIRAIALRNGNGVTTREQDDRVAVGWRARCEFRSDIAACTGLGIDNSPGPPTNPTVRRRRYAKGSLHSPCFSQRHPLRQQPVKQGTGGLQIRGRKALSEPIINRCKRCSCLVVATLAHPQTGHAEGDPQLPK